jgi:hypothetical protein
MPARPHTLRLLRLLQLWIAPVGMAAARAVGPPATVMATALFVLSVVTVVHQAAAKTVGLGILQQSAPHNPYYTPAMDETGKWSLATQAAGTYTDQGQVIWEIGVCAAATAHASLRLSRKCGSCLHRAASRLRTRHPSQAM